MDALPLYAIDELHEKVKEEKKISNFDVEHFFPVLESSRVIDLRTTFGTEPKRPLELSQTLKQLMFASST